MISVAVDAAPKEPEVYILLGKTYLARLDFDEAKNAFNQAAKLGPRSVVAQIELAKLHLQRGEVGTAIEFVEQALENEPANIEAQLTLVQGFIAQDEFQRAKGVLKTLLAKAPNAVEVHNAGCLATNDNVGARGVGARSPSIPTTSRALRQRAADGERPWRRAIARRGRPTRNPIATRCCCSQGKFVSRPATRKVPKRRSGVSSRSNCRTFWPTATGQIRHAEANPEARKNTRRSRSGRGLFRHTRCWACCRKRKITS